MPKRYYDWAEVQRFYDTGKSVRKCMAQFGFASQSFQKAVKRGDLKTRANETVAYIQLADYVAANNGKSGGAVRAKVRGKILREKAIPYFCAECGLTEWRGKPITLILDHKNGDNENHDLTNLQFVCPNCDMQSETWGHKNVGRKKKMKPFPSTDPGGEVWLLTR